MTTKIFFFDLDGTLRRPKSGAKFITNPEDQEPIPNTQKAVAHCAKTYLCVGITNQGGVAAGHKSLEDTIKEQRITLSLFPELQSIFFCSSYSGESCWQVSRELEPVEFLAPKDQNGIQISCRKPGYGMILIPAAVYDLPDADLINCWLAGDRPEDQECATFARINFMPADNLIEVGKNLNGLQ